MIMKIPLIYPKIPDSRNCPLKKCIVFEKIDGTNLHIHYLYRDWKSFGTRRDSFEYTLEGKLEFIKEHPELEKALDCDIELLNDLREYLKSLEKYNKEEIVLFFEFAGDKSFAGQHSENDNHRLWLIDVSIGERMLGPEEFLMDFASFNLYMPPIIFKGKYSGMLVENIKNGRMLVNEGCVIKGMIDSEFATKYNGIIQPYMCKVKTNAYMERLKIEFKDNWGKYWE